MGRRIGIGSRFLQFNPVIIIPIDEDEEMKYPIQTVNLVAGVSTLTTSITTPIYTVFILDENGIDITSAVDKSISFVGGIYELYVTSGVALNNVEIYLTY